MKVKFKVGDKVRRIKKYQFKNNWDHKDKVLTVESINPTCIRFEEISSSWDPDYFELVETETFEDKIVKAYKMIGTSVYWRNNNNKILQHKVQSIIIESNTIRLWNRTSGTYLDYGRIIEKPKEVEVKLNEAHNATVTENTIKVGCQTFPISIIDDLVKAKKELTID
jgi:hypothetical protein